MAQGQDGTILSASDMHGHTVAVKCERSSAPNTLRTEAAVYNAIHSNGHVRGFSRAHFHGRMYGRHVMVLDLLGHDLHHVVSQCGRLSLKKVLSIGVQVIEWLRTLYDAGFVHGDVKPSNLVLGSRGSYESRTVFLIDFGRSSRVQRGLAAFWGTRRVGHRQGEGHVSLTFGSSGALLGESKNARDDLESLVYTLVFLFKGELPWRELSGENDAEIMRRVAQIKRDIPLRELCGGMGRHFMRMCKTVRLIENSRRPHYEHLCRMLKNGVATCRRY